MAKAHKIWSGIIFCRTALFGGDCPVRNHLCLVKTSSQKRAVELLNEHIHKGHTVHDFRSFWSPTGNLLAKELTSEIEDEGIWVCTAAVSRTVEDYRRIV